MNDEIPAWAKDFKPRQNPPRAEVKLETPALDEQTLADLHKRSKEQLIALIRRVGGAIWGIGLKTEQEVFDALMLKSAALALTAEDVRDFVSAASQWLDRKKGKPAQSMQITADVNVTRRETEAELRKLPPERIREALRVLDMPVIENEPVDAYNEV